MTSEHDINPVIVRLLFEGDHAKAFLAHLLHGFSMIEEKWPPEFPRIDVDVIENEQELETLPHAFLIKGTADTHENSIKVTYVMVKVPVQRNEKWKAIDGEYCDGIESLQLMAEDVLARMCEVPGGLVWQARFTSTLHEVKSGKKEFIDELMTLSLQLPAEASPRRFGAQSKDAREQPQQVDSAAAVTNPELIRIAEHLHYVGYSAIRSAGSNGWCNLTHPTRGALFVREHRAMLELYESRHVPNRNAYSEEELLEMISDLYNAGWHMRVHLEVKRDRNETVNFSVIARMNIPRGLSANSLGVLLSIWLHETSVLGTMSFVE